MRFVFISDTHTQHRSMKPIPDGDVLVHCGDFSYTGEALDCVKFNSWFAAQSHQHKILVPGNHDLLFQSDERVARVLFDPSINILINQSIEIGGLLIYGSPYTPQFFDWAFMLPRNSEEMAACWAKIPDFTDVLITHGPPHGILDANSDRPPVHCGCEQLLERVKCVKPLVHAFGHLHEGYGQVDHNWYGFTSTQFVNASTCTAGYKPKNLPIVVDV